ncbi:hypothetical protein SELMODRAFT_116387 [Selaginella moellendorffii]|uniref:Uncharacterized protein n=2 Tax=Selaginella moellendorffii TaxID=88036 RepID=D8SG32_SELML|nr:hypothetical protein SELMODRAFT_116387 [Selaginella moellendorffii]
MALSFQIAASAATTPPSSSLSSSWKPRLSPVILVPGAGGNQLEVKLGGDYHGSRFVCRTFGFSHWFRLWLNVLGIIPPFTPCFAERIRLEYNGGSKTFHNPPGITTRVPGFGSTETMEYLDPTFKFLSGYMNSLVAALKAKGYESQKTLFGAPYDFRYAPGPNAAEVALQFLHDLKNLVEKASRSNKNTPVTLISHSLGGLWVLHFLNLQSSTWKKRFIHRFIAVSAPWGGSVQEMRVFASGYTEGANFLDPLVLRDEQRSSESNLWLLPSPKVFGNKTLVVGSSRNYTAMDLEDFFRDIGYSRGYEHYETRVPGLLEELAAPGVPVSLVFGVGVDTPETLVYEKQGFDYQPKMEYGDGDGTINLCSLRWVVDSWKKVGDQQVKVVELQGKTHTTVLKDEDAVEEIVKQLGDVEGQNLSS